MGEQQQTDPNFFPPFELKWRIQWAVSYDKPEKKGEAGVTVNLGIFKDPIEALPLLTQCKDEGKDNPRISRRYITDYEDAPDDADIRTV